MCIEGYTKKGSVFVESGAVPALDKVRCLACGVHYTRESWAVYYSHWQAKAKKEAVTTTTMGGGSEDGVEKHAAELRTYPDKRFYWSIDGAGCNMSNVMDMVSKAAEDWASTLVAAPVWADGTKEAYKRLGHALGLVPPPAAAPVAAAETVEHLDDGCVRVGGVRYVPVLGHGVPKALAEHYSYMNLAHALAQRMKMFDTANYFSPTEDTQYIAERLGYERKTPPKLLDAHDHLQQAVAALSESSVARDSPLHALIEQLAARVVKLPESEEDRFWRHAKHDAEQLITRAAEMLERSAEFHPQRGSMTGNAIERLVALMKPGPAEAPPPPPMKLAQRLAAFVEERDAMELAVRDWFEKTVVPASSSASRPVWSNSIGFRLVRAAIQGRRKVCYQFDKTTSESWADGAGVHLAYEDAGFSVLFESNVVGHSPHTTGDGSYGSVLVVKF